MKAAISAAQARRAAKLELSAEFVVGELQQLASVDVSNAYGDTGKIKALRDMPEPLRKAISRLVARFLE